LNSFAAPPAGRWNRTYYLLLAEYVSYVACQEKVGEL
jgi:hypothetical protein